MFTKIPESRPHTPLLDKIDSPADLKTLDLESLQSLADELRAFLLYSVAQTGGHFGAGLGVVELTIALHSILNTPEDDLIWDVGHQAYPHKILTGRRDRMQTMRTLGGLNPFPCREESQHDSFGTGHSSTSISAALGMALAKQLQNQERSTVAVIGDGAMTAGMAFEALNHAAFTRASMLIILNDNAMSISSNVGGVASYLERVLHGDSDAKSSAPGVRTGNVFEDLGIRYSGPVDGHDIKVLRNKIRKLLKKPGPSLLHIKTVKGYGYSAAVEDPVAYHALTKIEKNKGELNFEKNKRNSADLSSKKFQDIFGDWLCQQAEQDQCLVAITPAMKEGSGLSQFSERFPQRFYDVAIAEQHAVTLAAGLACKELRPVVAIYSTFLQRAYDQIVHDIALQNLNVLFAIDRAGVVGEDGKTHTGAYDINILRCLPNFIIAAPSSKQECKLLLYAAYQHEGPAAVRYPRGRALSAKYEEETAARVGKAVEISKGKLLCILNFGALLHEAMEVSQKQGYGLVDMRWIKPLDETLLDKLANEYTYFVTLEDGAKLGGAGTSVMEYFNQAGVVKPVLQLGLDDTFIEHGKRQEILEQAGLNKNKISTAITSWLTRFNSKKN